VGVSNEVRRSGMIFVSSMSMCKGQGFGVRYFYEVLLRCCLAGKAIPVFGDSPRTFGKGFGAMHAGSDGHVTKGF